MPSSLTIREVAARSGVPAGTLRMWEERYGFPKPERLPSGHRRFSEDQVDQVRAVVAAREGGLSLPAAIERINGAPAERRESLYALLRLRRPELALALLDLVVELGEVGMSGVWGQVRGHPVHADVSPVEVVEYGVQALDRHAQVRAGLPAPRVVRGQPAVAEDLDCESEPHYDHCRR